MKQVFSAAMLSVSLAVPLLTVADGSRVVGADHSTPIMAEERSEQNTGPTRIEAGMSQGEVRRVDKMVGKLTLRHGPLMNLDMPAMTMVFRVKDPAWLAQLKVGDKIRFLAERVDGNLTVTALEFEPQ